MTALYTCTKCRASYGVPAQDTNVRLLKKSMRCPNVGCAGQLRYQASTNAAPTFEVTNMSALELYQATLGAGLPSEKKCSPASMKKLLAGATILSASLDKAPSPDRSIVLSLKIRSGKVVREIHLASSTHGATIYKVTEDTRGR